MNALNSQPAPALALFECGKAVVPTGVSHQKKVHQKCDGKLNAHVELINSTFELFFNAFVSQPVLVLGARVGAQENGRVCREVGRL